MTVIWAVASFLFSSRYGLNIYKKFSDFVAVSQVAIRYVLDDIRFLTSYGSVFWSSMCTKLCEVYLLVMSSHDSETLFYNRVKARWNKRLVLIVLKIVVVLQSIEFLWCGGASLCDTRCESLCYLDIVIYVIGLWSTLLRVKPPWLQGTCASILVSWMPMRCIRCLSNLRLDNTHKVAKIR